MSYSGFINDCHVDSKRFYDYVVEEINKRNIPSIQYDWRKETALTKTGSFWGFTSSESEEALVLRAFDLAHQACILGYAFADSFHVSVRVNWVKKYRKHLEDMLEVKIEVPYLAQVRFTCFGKIVSGATQAALDRYLSECQHEGAIDIDSGRIEDVLDVQAQ